MKNKYRPVYEEIEYTRPSSMDTVNKQEQYSIKNINNISSQYQERPRTY